MKTKGHSPRFLGELVGWCFEVARRFPTEGLGPSRNSLVERLEIQREEENVLGRTLDSIPQVMARWGRKPDACRQAETELRSPDRSQATLRAVHQRKRRPSNQTTAPIRRRGHRVELFTTRLA